MKIVYVVDCVSELTQKINLIKNRFGNNILYVVRADLVELFKTYGFIPNAIYYKNLTSIIHTMLLKTEVEDLLICYSSLKFDDKLLTKFINTIGTKTKIVSLMPQYNVIEQVCNSAYNVYVKSLFKVKDSLVSPKLQFIPQELSINLISSHLGNRLFEIEPEMCKNISVENAEINKSMKTKTPVLKYNLIACLIALVLTIGLITSIVWFKPHFLIIFAFIILYILDIMLTIILHCKNKFDRRFLK